MKRILRRGAALLLALGLTGGCACAQDGPLPPRPLPMKDVAVNPYMACSDNSIHNDVYATDVTDAVAPLGICSTVSTALETQNPHAPSAAFYDSRGNAITPFLGGVAVTDMDGEVISRSGSFVPARDDGGGYSFQISYSFVDRADRVVAPTSHGHLLVLRTMDAGGEVLPVFEKVMDVDIVAQAVAALGEDIDQRLLSVVYDYEGNLWFTTGGFRIDPERDPAGFLGYISRDYMQQLDTGEAVPLEGNIFFYPLAMGEGAENGIAANPHGAVILTNLACYLLAADGGVQVRWRTPYGSNGANEVRPESGYTGGGLSWGIGTSPTLTDDLVLFTDNLDPINLLALSCETGEIVARIPVLDALGEDVPVSVENSILVYDGGEGTVSVVVANWYGAGNAGLADPDANSSIQSYDNIYDANWMARGNAYIAPGVERVDVVRTADGYEARKIWSRPDIHETAMIKLSTATGYLYGYWQDLGSGMWRYEVLDFGTGETLLTEDVSTAPGYNNLAVGLIADPGGNGLYSPTGAMDMVCWRDVFAYLPDSPARDIPPQDTGRSRLLDGALPDGLQAAGYLMTVAVDNLRQEETLALRLNGLTDAPSAYTLFYQDPEGDLREMSEGWTLCASGGGPLDGDRPLEAGEIYEIRLSISDGGPLDRSEETYHALLGVVLAQAAKEE